MKKCPTCDKTFEDSMRFCQVDGTPLVDEVAAEPAFDPYATIVSSPRPAVPEPEPEPVHALAAESPADAIPVPEPVASPIAEPDEVLDLPEHDPLKTVMVTDSELREALGESATDVDSSAAEIPADEETPAPVAPSFSVPDVPAPSFGGAPPSPFSTSEPSAFDEPAPPPPPVFDEPASEFDEAATMIQPPLSAPFEPPPAPAFEPELPTPAFEPPHSAFETPIAAPVAEWTPPPAPDASWQNQDIGSNTPFQPPMGGSGKLNQTLPIVSLVLGIVSICCPLGVITGAAALITGFMGMKNVNNDPQNYGGKGLAIAGMAVGGIFLILSIVWWILQIIGVGLSSMGR